MKIVKLIIAAFALAGSVQAATITLSSGLSTQGVVVTVNSVAAPGFNLAIGTWDSLTSTFTTFGTSFADTDKINGAQTSTDTFFNGKQVAVFLGTGTDIASSADGWVVFTRATTLNYPANVVPAGNTTFTVSSSSVVNILAKGNQDSGFSNANTLNLVTVPEPSIALLGALGVFGLVRRRR
jgi:3',5'-cyclic AMP phosphodiesterase CpdA